MKSILRIATATAATATFVAAALTNFGPLADALNPAVAKFIVMAMSAALGIKEIAVVVGDYADDGKRNNSFDA
jgi:deoxyribodipyrimidine photolyase-like uncharacterized protein